MSHHSRTKSFSFNRQPSSSRRDNRSGIMKGWIDGSKNGHKKRCLSFNIPAKSYSISMDESNSGESSIDNSGSIQTFHQFEDQDMGPMNSEVIGYNRIHRLTLLIYFTILIIILVNLSIIFFKNRTVHHPMTATLKPLLKSIMKIQKKIRAQEEILRAWNLI